MLNALRGLVSWMDRDMRRDQLLTWAKTEYKKDWQFAYQFMLENNGRSPSSAELNGRIIRKEVA